MAHSTRYEIKSKLGEGGMGVVYLAYDTWLGREVAMKTVLPPDGQAPLEWQQGVQRLMREAKAAAGLKHPNIVTIYDVIPDEGSPCIIMEYVAGKTLAHAALLGKPAEPSFAVRVLKECAGALDYAHARRIVHRDIKPANIMLNEGGSAMVMDFGIVKFLDSETT